ncbi:MAG: glycoside hydrolase family 3 protein, partial [Gemmatimonadota bacterium]|nr:glycoside hydrolase family 3 protein [Gemmatimonadota bacterium]
MMHRSSRLRLAVRSLSGAVLAGLVLTADGCSRRPTVSAPTGRSVEAAGGRVALQMPQTNLAPGSPLTREQLRWVDSTLETLSPRERIGQMVWRWVLGDYANVADSSYANARRDVEEHRVGGITMSLGTPIEVAAKINSLQRAARVPLIVSSDLEPGLGRLEGGLFSHYLLDAGSATVFPQAMAIGATGRDEDAYDVARTIGREARAVGIQINFAPTVDVNNNPGNPVINVRSFGEDPERVARLAAQWVRGSHEAGVIATAKHFPGHGDTDVDSHVGLPVVSASRERLNQLELVPFRAAIQAGAPMVMTAHIALPAVSGDSSTPATLSPRIITDLLREDLGFRGVTITDALTMEGVGRGYTAEESAVLAVKAGSDILLMPRDAKRAIDAVAAAVDRGDIPKARIDAAARRVLELKARTGVAFRPMVDLEALRTVVGSPEHRALADDVARRAITLLRDNGNVLPVSGGRVVVVQYMPETELKAGRWFAREMGVVRPSHVFKITPRSGREELDSIARAARGADRVVITAHVRRVEGEGRASIPPHVASWVDELAQRERVVFVAHGNPYLIRQVPNVDAYVVTYGVGDALERAAARALMGR